MTYDHRYKNRYVTAPCFGNKKKPSFIQIAVYGLFIAKQKEGQKSKGNPCTAVT
jgi:hypothetical protein